MAIYIKGMEMPKYCNECRCICSRWNGNEMIWRCGLMLGEESESVDRDELHERCPLTEIPEPHGRLIDADKLADDLEYDALHYDEDHEMKLNCASWLRSESTPTVIEGSE